MIDRLNVMIVDDSEDDRDLYKRLLAKQGGDADYRYFEAATAKDAVMLCQSVSVDCILLDFNMPGRNGLELLEELRTNEKHMPVVMLTGQGNEKIAAESIKGGAQEYLSKNDLTGSALHRVIHNTVERVKLRRKVDEHRADLATFANVLAHDLKAPINVIRGMNDLIQEAIEQGCFDEVKEFSDRIERSALRTSQLIDTLRIYNRSSNTDRPLAVVCLEDLLQDALNNLHFDIEEKQAEITHGELPSVLADPPQIVQLLQNLIGNSIKYCKADKPVIHIDAQENGEFWQVDIRDNGIGLEEEDLVAIFKPFHRAHSEDEFAGTGLGLATCKRILDRHRGRIWCDSEKGTGSTFSFSLLKAAGNAQSNENENQVLLDLEEPMAMSG
nr:ATP-binding protein [uncultured Cohaesibacter sp.]